MIAKRKVEAFWL